MEKIRIAIADDDAGMRMVVRKLIERADDYALVGEAENGEELLALVEKTRPEVVFMDGEMPGMSGVECARAIQDMDPAIVIIFASRRCVTSGDFPIRAQQRIRRAEGQPGHADFPRVRLQNPDGTPLAASSHEDDGLLRRRFALVECPRKTLFFQGAVLHSENLLMNGKLILLLMIRKKSTSLVATRKGQGGDRRLRLFLLPLVASAEAKSPACGKDQLWSEIMQRGRTHLARQCASSG